LAAAGAARWRLLAEPGRWLVAASGCLLTAVLGVKDQAPGRVPPLHFAVLDAAMNDLLRPALYQAHHEAIPATLPAPDDPAALYDLVGPVCETGDFLGKERWLPALRRGTLLAVCHAGAYGSAMASNYNSRGRAPEVLVKDAAFRVIRARESYDDLVGNERL
jgi:diaminopimelate decarboxylase